MRMHETMIAYFTPRLYSTYSITTFGRPILIPGTAAKMGGSKNSTYDKRIASAAEIPTNAIFLVLI